MKKRTVLTGITPTGTPHLGNYVSAIKPCIAASHDEDVQSYYFLADYATCTTDHIGTSPAGDGPVGPVGMPAPSTTRNPHRPAFRSRTNSSPAAACSWRWTSHAAATRPDRPRPPARTDGRLPGSRQPIRAGRWFRWTRRE